jgi:hypothetical protein
VQFQLIWASSFCCLYAAFTEPLFNFIENAVRNGESVLVSLHLLFMKNVVVGISLVRFCSGTS